MLSRFFQESDHLLALSRFFQESDHLLARYAGESLEELLDRVARFQMIEQTL